MAQVQHPTPAPEYVASMANSVISVTEARIFAVSWADGEGQRQMALVLSFGTDINDQGPGVWVLADQKDMMSQLRVPNQLLKKGVRAFLASQKKLEAEDLPPALTDIV